ncbi:hypothetical protein EV586_102104 [Tumebacillus sp. BK434]|nr:hypothetical protein EV586_102104 [Tumebacillus sp. BK434]
MKPMKKVVKASVQAPRVTEVKEAIHITILVEL